MAILEENMVINSQLFEAYLKCATKCYLKATGEAGAGNQLTPDPRLSKPRVIKKSISRNPCVLKIIPIL
jgi:hypothetical protein